MKAITTRLLLLVFFIQVALTAGAQSPTFSWAKKAGGSNGDRGETVGMDASGNVFIVGSFYGTVDFDPGPGTAILTSNYDKIFAQKLDPNGNLLWVKAINGFFRPTDQGCVVDPSGNIIIGGQFSGTVDLDPGSGTYNLTSNGAGDALMIKLDAGGNFVWAKGIGGLNYDEVWGITCDAAGNIYSTGYYDGSPNNIDFDPGTGVYNILGSGYRIVKLDANGNLVWASRTGDIQSSIGSARSVSVDKDGNVYTSGDITNKTDFDEGPAHYYLDNTLGDAVFVKKFDATGKFVWARAMGSNAQAYTCRVDNDGNVYITGTYVFQSDFDPDSTTTHILASPPCATPFILKLDKDGKFVWVRSTYIPRNGGGFAFFVDKNNDIYSAGYFWDQMDFDFGTGTHLMTPVGGTDAFIMKMDADANFIWAKAMAGIDNEMCYSVFVGPTGTIAATGYFEGTIDMDPEASTYNLSSSGDEDIFVMKLEQPGFVTGVPALLSDAVKVYPNPTSGRLYIEPGESNSTTYVKVTDVTGRLISLNSYSNTGIVSININEPAGLYFVSVSSADKVVSYKILKE